jgi:hypothetical protein
VVAVPVNIPEHDSDLAVVETSPDWGWIAGMCEW